MLTEIWDCNTAKDSKQRDLLMKLDSIHFNGLKQFQSFKLVIRLFLIVEYV